jgi:hypothetical protein
VPGKPANGATPRQRSAAARARLLAAASELCYAEGVQSVGTDRVIEHAGVDRDPSAEDAARAMAAALVSAAIPDTAGG